MLELHQNRWAIIELSAPQEVKDICRMSYKAQSILEAISKEDIELTKTPLKSLSAFRMVHLAYGRFIALVRSSFPREGDEEEDEETKITKAERKPIERLEEDIKNIESIITEIETKKGITTATFPIFINQSVKILELIYLILGDAKQKWLRKLDAKPHEEYYRATLSCLRDLDFVCLYLFIDVPITERYGDFHKIVEAVDDIYTRIVGKFDTLTKEHFNHLTKKYLHNLDSFRNAMSEGSLPETIKEKKEPQKLLMDEEAYVINDRLISSKHDFLIIKLATVKDRLELLEQIGMATQDLSLLLGVSAPNEELFRDCLKEAVYRHAGMTPIVRLIKKSFDEEKKIVEELEPGQPVDIVEEEEEEPT